MNSIAQYFWEIVAIVLGLIGLWVFTKGIAGHRLPGVLWCRRCTHRVDGIPESDRAVVCPECGFKHTDRKRPKRSLRKRGHIAFGALLVSALPLVAYQDAVRHRWADEGWSAFAPTSALVLLYPGKYSDALQPNTFGNWVHETLNWRKRKTRGWQTWMLGVPELDVADFDMQDWVSSDEFHVVHGSSYAGIQITPQPVSNGQLHEILTVTYRTGGSDYVTLPASPGPSTHSSSRLARYQRGPWVSMRLDGSGSQTIEFPLQHALNAINTPFSYERTIVQQVNCSVYVIPAEAVTTVRSVISAVRHPRIDEWLTRQLFSWLDGVPTGEGDQVLAPPEGWLALFYGNVSFRVELTLLVDGTPRARTKRLRWRSRSEYEGKGFTWGDLRRLQKEDPAGFRERVTVRVTPNTETQYSDNQSPLWLPAEGDSLEIPLADLLPNTQGDARE